jgi:hypothetical protein
MSRLSWLPECRIVDRYSDKLAVWFNRFCAGVPKVVSLAFPFYV